MILEKRATEIQALIFICALVEKERIIFDFSHHKKVS
jgi:hypothetical protein